MLRTATYLTITKHANFSLFRPGKKPEDKNRANLWWVDVNGDRKADMVWLDKFGG
jgi:hypothetical protein